MVDVSEERDYCRGLRGSAASMQNRLALRRGLHQRLTLSLHAKLLGVRPEPTSSSLPFLSELCL